MRHLVCVMTCFFVATLALANLGTAFGHSDVEFGYESGKIEVEFGSEGRIFEGDFDLDGDVDGEDYLLWQQGLSPDPLSAGDLSDWQTNYGTNPPPLLQSAVGIPEPQTALLCLLGMALLFGSKPRFQIMSG